MKTTVIAIIVGLTFSGLALAGKNVKNNEQLEDQIHGYQKTPASASQPANNNGMIENNQQKEDLVHGYGKLSPSESEPATVHVGKTNNEQQEDLIHGYKK